MDLDALRTQIDGIDEKMVALFKERMQVSADVARYKQEQGLPVRQKHRERQVLSHVSELAGDVLAGYTRVLYRTLMDLSSSYQMQLNEKATELTQAIQSAIENTPTLFPKDGIVACAGVEGSYSQQACDKLFEFPSIMYFKNFEAVFQAVERGLCQYGILPIENSSYGSVNQVYDLMQHYNFHSVRSIRLHIHHNLLAKPGVKLSDVKEIFSHEQAIGQCSQFLNGMPDVKITMCDNTATAAKMVAESDRRDVAAICSHDCGDLYGLNILEESVQNNENNYTRFICIKKDIAIYPGANHISIMCTTPHTPGSLYRLISKFTALGVNLTKLESRPLPGRDFEVLFYFDMEASVWSPEIIQLMGELSSTSELFVFLGCYSEI